MWWIVDSGPKDRRAINHPSVALAPSAFLLLINLSLAGDGDLPDLIPPADTPIVSKPTTPLLRPARGASRRAVLAIPGLTTPTARLQPPSELTRPSPGELSLDSPVEMRPGADSFGPTPGPASTRAGRPLVLESSPMAEDPTEVPGGSPTRSIPSERRTTITPKPALLPARRPRFFGLLPAPALGSASNTKPSDAPGRSLAEPLPDEIASEAALKRRIERQAREVVGNRARSVEVKLSGKEAVVHVGGAKFLQKRAIRKQLEGIPALAGLRSTIDVVD